MRVEVRAAGSPMACKGSGVQVPSAPRRATRRGTGSRRGGGAPITATIDESFDGTTADSSQSLGTAAAAGPANPTLRPRPNPVDAAEARRQRGYATTCAAA